MHPVGGHELRDFEEFLDLRLEAANRKCAAIASHAATSEEKLAEARAAHVFEVGEVDDQVLGFGFIKFGVESRLEIVVGRGVDPSRGAGDFVFLI